MKIFREMPFNIGKLFRCCLAAVLFFGTAVMGGISSRADDLSLKDTFGTSDFTMIENVDLFTLPSYLGSVKYRGQGKSGRMVIHIQDAHCNRYAQKKVSEIISFLNREYGISDVNLEGGAGDYDLSVFTGIDDLGIRRKTAEYFLRWGRMNGAEFYAANNPGKVVLWGVEDPALYMKNLEVYRGLSKYTDEADRCLGQIEEYLSGLKPFIFNDELIEMDSERTAYKRGNTEFRDYLDFLLSKSLERGIDPKRYPDIYLLKNAMDEEDNIDFEETNDQRDVLIDRLEDVLSRKEKERLALKIGAFRAKKISPRTFYEYLIEKAKSTGQDLDEYPELRRYIVYISLYEAVDRAGVLSDMGSLESEIKETMFTDDKQRELDTLSNHLTLLENMFDILLTREDYRYYREKEKEFDAVNFAGFILKECPACGIAVRFSKGMTELDEWRKNTAEFYKYSFYRDDAFLEKLKFSGGDRGACVLVTGGFHTDNLMELFEDKGISYLSIIPDFTSEKGYESPYFEILGGGGLSLAEEAVRSAFFTLQVASMWNSLGAEVDAYDDARISEIAAMTALFIRRGLSMAKDEGGPVAFPVRGGNSAGKYLIAGKEDGILQVVDHVKAGSSGVRIMEDAMDVEDLMRSFSETVQDRVIKEAKRGEERKYITGKNPVVADIFSRLKALREAAVKSGIKDMGKKIELMKDVLSDLIRERTYENGEKAPSGVQIISKLDVSHAGGQGIYISAEAVFGVLEGRKFDTNELELGDITEGEARRLSGEIIHELSAGLFSGSRGLTSHEIAGAVQAAFEENDPDAMRRALEKAVRHSLDGKELTVWEMTPAQRLTFSYIRDYGGLINTSAKKLADQFIKVFREKMMKWISDPNTGYMDINIKDFDRMVSGGIIRENYNTEDEKALRSVGTWTKKLFPQANFKELRGRLSGEVSTGELREFMKAYIFSRASKIVIENGLPNPLALKLRAWLKNNRVVSEEKLRSISARDFTRLMIDIQGEWYRENGLLDAPGYYVNEQRLKSYMDDIGVTANEVYEGPNAAILKAYMFNALREVEYDCKQVSDFWGGALADGSFSRVMMGVMSKKGQYDKKSAFSLWMDNLIALVRVLHEKEVSLQGYGIRANIEKLVSAASTPQVLGRTANLLRKFESSDISELLREIGDTSVNNRSVRSGNARLIDYLNGLGRRVDRNIDFSGYEDDLYSVVEFLSKSPEEGYSKTELWRIMNVPVPVRDIVIEMLPGGTTAPEWLQDVEGSNMYVKVENMKKNVSELSVVLRSHLMSHERIVRDLIIGSSSLKNMFARIDKFKLFVDYLEAKGLVAQIDTSTLSLFAKRREFKEYWFIAVLLEKMLEITRGEDVPERKYLNLDPEVSEFLNGIGVPGSQILSFIDDVELGVYKRGKAEEPDNLRRIREIAPRILKGLYRRRRDIVDDFLADYNRAIEKLEDPPRWVVAGSEKQKLLVYKEMNEIKDAFRLSHALDNGDRKNVDEFTAFVIKLSTSLRVFQDISSGIKEFLSGFDKLKLWDGDKTLKVSSITVMETILRKTRKADALKLAANIINVSGLENKLRGYDLDKMMSNVFIMDFDSHRDLEKYVETVNDSLGPAAGNYNDLSRELIKLTERGKPTGSFLLRDRVNNKYRLVPSVNDRPAEFETRKGVVALLNDFAGYNASNPLLELVSNEISLSAFSEWRDIDSRQVKSNRMQDMDREVWGKEALENPFGGFNYFSDDPKNLNRVIQGLLARMGGYHEMYMRTAQALKKSDLVFLRSYLKQAATAIGGVTRLVYYYTNEKDGFKEYTGNELGRYRDAVPDTSKFTKFKVPSKSRVLELLKALGFVWDRSGRLWESDGGSWIQPMKIGERGIFMIAAPGLRDLSGKKLPYLEENITITGREGSIDILREKRELPFGEDTVTVLRSDNGDYHIVLPEEQRDPKKIKGAVERAKKYIMTLERVFIPVQKRDGESQRLSEPAEMGGSLKQLWGINPSDKIWLKFAPDIDYAGIFEKKGPLRLLTFSSRPDVKGIPVKISFNEATGGKPAQIMGRFVKDAPSRIEHTIESSENTGPVVVISIDPAKYGESRNISDDDVKRMIWNDIVTLLDHGIEKSAVEKREQAERAEAYRKWGSAKRERERKERAEDIEYLYALRTWCNISGEGI